MASTELGAFLKARRGQVAPEQVRLPAGTRRRVAGLRREEVAMLAGISVDYYSRMEQGREKTPSPSVLNALARALLLDPAGAEHLFRLAGLTPADIPADDPEEVDAALLSLLDAWPQTPALIINRRLDILARNELSAALYSDFAAVDNLARMTFADPAARHFFADWQRAAEASVANLRLALGYSGDGGRTRELVRQLHTASADFRSLWSRHEVRGKTYDSKSFVHNDVGSLTLEYHSFDVRSAPGQQLVVYRAEPGTADAEKLSLLGTLAVTRQEG